MQTSLTRAISKLEKNLIENRFSLLNSKINYQMLNTNYESYKMICEDMLIKNQYLNQIRVDLNPKCHLYRFHPLHPPLQIHRAHSNFKKLGFVSEELYWTKSISGE